MKDAKQHENSSTAMSLMEAYRLLISVPSGKEQDSYTLAQPSPMRYVPSITTDHTLPATDTGQ